MSGLRARVKNGRLILDEATSLPEGTIVDLVIDDEGEDLDATDRAAREEAIRRGWESAKAGRGRSASDVLDDLRRR
jgi:hypothetical protein